MYWIEKKNREDRNYKVKRRKLIKRKKESSLGSIIYVTSSLL